MKQDHSDFPTDTAATDHLQHWHVPPRHDVSARPVEGITNRKAEYGKVVHWFFGHRYGLYPFNAKSNYDHAQAQQLVSTTVPDTSYLRFYVELPSRLSAEYRAV